VRHKLEVGEWCSLASHYTLTTADVCFHPMAITPGILVLGSIPESTYWKSAKINKNNHPQMLSEDIYSSRLHIQHIRDDSSFILWATQVYCLIIILILTRLSVSNVLNVTWRRRMTPMLWRNLSCMMGPTGNTDNKTDEQQMW